LSRGVPRIAVIDYGMGNRRSVQKAFERIGATVSITRDHAELLKAHGLVLPGVGAFPLAMRNLQALGLDRLIRDRAAEAVPLLGICLGMQLLFELSLELGETRGLGLLRGEVTPLDTGGLRVPHIGWNEVRHDHADADTLFRRVPDRADFYFVHSYHVVCADERDVLATTPYCGGFTSVVQHGSVLGTQFHPEKSQVHGLALLRSFVESWC
jgi:imidazole glycerol-phosphate synthase subunit HisH